MPYRTEEAIICEAVRLAPQCKLPYEFELRECEILEFIFRSEIPIDVLLSRMSDYEAWVSPADSPGQPLLIYTEAVATVVHAIEFVAPEDASYVAVLLNNKTTQVDVAVEIKLSPPTAGVCL